MLNFFKKKEVKTKELILVAPVNGLAINLADVPDQVFAQKMMGDGLAFQYSEPTIYSPANGKVKMIADTNHAIGIDADGGTEILIHIGLDTVSLGGQGFDVHVKVGDSLKVGQPLITINREFMEKNNIDLTTPMIITNGNDLNGVSILTDSSEVVKGETSVIKIG